MSLKSQGNLKASAKPFVPQDQPVQSTLGNMSHASSHVQPVSTARKEVKKNKKYSSASGLLSFQFDRPLQESPTAPVRKSAGNHRNKVLTKAQYLQANFRFVLSPFTNPLESCLYDPGVIIPWDCVASVIVPPESEDSVAESSTLICPVCLDAARIPRMTKCGHTYWHMSNDRSNRNKCPMCSEVIDHDDLKPIQRNKTESTSGVLPIGSSLKFELIEVQKGNISVQVAGSAPPSAASSGALRLTDVIPSISDVNAPYCRVVSATVEYIRDQFVEQQRQVAQYKQLCRSEHQLFDAGDVEAIPYLDEAESYIAAGRRKFEAKLAQELANGSILGADEDSVTKAAVTINNLSIAQDVGSMSGVGGGVTDVSSVFRVGRTPTNTAVATSSSNSRSNTSIQVYQKCGGDLVYLHPLCTKCILTHFDQPAAEDSTEARTLPTSLTGTIVDVETIRITAEIKQRFSILRHLPLYAVVSLVEIDLIGLVDNSVLALFDQELHKRALKRIDKQKKEKRERKQDEDKRLAEELVRADRIAHYHSLKEKQDRDIQQLLSGPTVGSTVAAAPSQDVIDSPTVAEESNSTVTAPKDPNVISFAEVTLMGGSFPTLSTANAKSSSSGSGGTSNSSVGAWGKPKVPEPKSPATGSASSSDGGSVWARGAKATSEENQADDAAPGGKKGKKFTKVNLLSNSSSRSYR